MTGLFVAIVGPSGVGKDSLIRGLAARLPVKVARRVVTRDADVNEDHDTLDEAAFLRAEQGGQFALSWSAHGLKYGIPVEVTAAVSRGEIVVANLSRGAVGVARERFERLFVILVAASPETLAKRLVARGREDGEGRESRLARASAPEVAFKPDAILDNDGELDEAVTRLVALVTQEAAQ